MKVKTLPLLAGAAGMLAVTGLAHAGITGLYAESAVSNTLTNTTLEGTTYSIYVQFDDPTDRFISALDGDIEFTGNLFQSDDPDFATDLGPHAGAAEGLVENLAADSYLAVNDGGPGGDGSYDPAAFANGGGITGGWFVSPPTDDANAVDENNRVLVMVLTFEGAGHPQVEGMITTDNGDGNFSSDVLADLMLGSIRFSYNPEGVAGGITGVTVNFVPAPGALALLGVAGLVGKRRRRA